MESFGIFSDENKRVNSATRQANIEGNPRIDNLPLATLQILITWYKEQFYSLTEHEKVTYLEQFIQQGLVTDDEASMYAEQLSTECKEALGLFLGQVMETTEWKATFQECWSAINFEKQAFFKDLFSREHPTRLPLVVPFINSNSKNLHTVVDRQKKDSGLATEVVFIPDHFYQAPTEAGRLFESLLTYYEKHRSEVRKIPPEHVTEGGSGLITLKFREYHGHKDSLRSWVEYYAGKGNLEVLLPHIERLYALGEITSAERESLYTPKYDSWAETLVLRRARETVLKDSQISVGMHDVTDSKYDNFEGMSYTSFEHQRPRESALQLQTLTQQSLLQEGEALLKNFSEYKEHIGDQLDFIHGVSYAGFPALCFLNQLGLSKSDVATLFKKAEDDGISPLKLFDGSEVSAVLSFDKSSAEDISLEQVLTNHIRQLLLRYQHDRGVMVGLIINIGAWLDGFSEAGKQTLLQTINDTNPAIWVYNPTFALLYSGLSQKELVGLCATEPQQFFYEYQYFRHSLAHSAINETEKKELLAEAERAFVDIVEQDPLLLIDIKQGPLIESLLGREKVVELLRQLVKAPLEERLIDEIVRSKYLEDLREDFKELISNSPQIFCYFTGALGRCEKLQALFSREEIVALIKLHFASVSVGTLFSRQHIGFFTREEVRYFISLATEVGCDHQLHELAFALHQYEQNRIDKHKDLREIHNKLNQDRAFLAKLLQTSGKGSYESLTDMQTKLDHIKKRMRVLKHEQLEQALLAPFAEECDAARDSLEIICQNNPSLVFSEEVLNVLGERARPLIILHIDEYAKKHPMVLGRDRYDDGFGEEIKAAIGREHYAALLEEHARFLVFQKQKRPGQCEFRFARFTNMELRDMFEAMDPFNAVNVTKYRTDDYYDYVLDGIKSMTYYPLLSRQLQQIAQEQQKTHGVQTDYVTPPGEFAELVQLVALLEHSTLALSLASAVERLPVEEQRQAMECLFVAALYNLDRDALYNEEPPKLEVFRETTTRLFIERLAEYLETPADYLNQTLSFSTLRAFGEFYQTALKENSDAKKAFVSVLDALTTYEYEDWKQWGGTKPTNETEAAAQLEALKDDKLVPVEASLAMYESWCETIDKDFDEVLTYEIGDVVYSIRQILAQGVADAHITDEALGGPQTELEMEYELLIEPLKRITSELSEYTELLKTRRKNEAQTPQQQREFERVEQAFRRLKEAQVEYRERTGAAIDKLTAQLYLDRLRHLSTHELKNGVVFFAKKEVKFDRVLKMILEVFQGEFPGITEDVYRIQKALEEGRRNVFGETKVSRKKLTITDRVDFETYFHIGQHPVPSCQSFASTLGYSEGLLSYVADPGVKVIQVWDEDNALIARSVVRLMEDKHKTPALFVERVYSVNAHHKITEAILSFAIAKADSMGISAYTTENNKVAAKGVSALFNTGTRSSATYSDAGGGLTKGGAFKVPLAREI